MAKNTVGLRLAQSGSGAIYFGKVMKNRVRFPQLDVLRFLAACAVMLFHYTFRGPHDQAWNGVVPFLGQIFKYGYLGVDVFFILSGFVILLTAYEKDAVSFTIARIVRLYPAYWICVTLTTVAVVLAGHKPSRLGLGQYLANLTMAHSFFGIRDVSGVYWTLAVELKFYFLVFLVLLAQQVRRISLLLGVWLLASVLLSLRGPGGVVWFFLFPEWSSYFIAGCMFFLIHREGPNAYKLCVIAGCFCLSVAYALQILPASSGPLSADISGPILIILLALFYLIFLLLSLRPKLRQHAKQRITAGMQRISEPAPRSTQRWLYTLGLMTYPLYLLHQDIGYILLRVTSPFLNGYAALALVIALMIGLSWVVQAGPEKWLAVRLKPLLSGVGKTSPIRVPIWFERLRGKWPFRQRTASIGSVTAAGISPLPTTVRDQPELPPGGTPPRAGSVEGDAS